MSNYTCKHGKSYYVTCDKCEAEKEACKKELLTNPEYIEYLRLRSKYGVNDYLGLHIHMVKENDRNDPTAG